MEHIKNKYYIRLDENNQIIKTFSNVFEEPVESDILINEGYGSQFRASKENLSEELQQYADVENGLPLINENGQYQLTYDLEEKKIKKINENILFQQAELLKVEINTNKTLHFDTIKDKMFYYDENKEKVFI